MVLSPLLKKKMRHQTRMKLHISQTESADTPAVGPELLRTTPHYRNHQEQTQGRHPTCLTCPQPSSAHTHTHTQKPKGFNLLILESEATHSAIKNPQTLKEIKERRRRRHFLSHICSGPPATPSGSAATASLLTTTEHLWVLRGNRACCETA